MIKLLWIKGVTDEKTVEEARRRINNIDIDIVSGVGNLSEMIQDNVLRIFPTFMITERPDKVARHLCDGQFAILVNNSPAAFVAPISIVDFFKTIDDYAERSVLGSFMRVIRYISVFIATSISALYTSFVTYNQNIMPPALAFSIAKGREDVPFPTIVELLLMTFIIDIIREGGVRMPGAVGFTLGIIGAVVISDAAVSAGIISPSLIIVIAMSALASFAVPAPQLSNTVRVINYSFIVLSGLFGITGYITGVLVLLLFLVSQ
jgi:spore germination protein KA